MTIDRRELVLARIFKALTEVNVFKEVYRNRDDVSASAVACAIIIDGNEVTSQQESEPARVRRPSAATVMVTMNPDIIVLTEAESGEKLGPLLNDLRVTVLKTLVLDTELAAIVTTNGGVRYDGAEMVIGTGKKVEGSMIVHLSFDYPLEYGKL